MGRAKSARRSTRPRRQRADPPAPERRTALPSLPKCADCPSSAIQPAAHPTYCGRCWQRRRRKGLLPPGSVDNERRHAYYSVLQEDPDFVAAFKALYARLFPGFARRFAGYAEWDAAIREAGRRGETSEDAAAVTDFCKTWSLPHAAEQEIWGSCFYTTNYGQPLCLRALWDGHLQPPAPPVLDPLFESAAEADRARQRRRRAALKAGWRELPPWAKGWAQLKRQAWRLHLRAVKRLTSTEIQERERQRGVFTSAAAIRTSTNAWAQALGITLPPPRRTRPKA